MSFLRIPKKIEGAFRFSIVRVLSAYWRAHGEAGRRRCIFLQVLQGLCILMGFLGLVGALGVWAKEVEDKKAKPEYHDIYLTEGRVCRRCTGMWVSAERLQLTNRLGERALVNASDVIGVDRHPIARKLLIRSLHGIGLSGPAIVPYAFHNGQDYVCKYCP